MNNYIDALLQERAGYVKRNLPERVKSVDDALRRLGFNQKYMTEEPQIETASIEVEVEKTVLKRGKKKKA